jgi:hypothetical protein
MRLSWRNSGICGEKVKNAGEKKKIHYVPEAGKNLIFAYCIGKDGYQVVLPSDNATFPPGVYCPRPARRPLKADSDQQPRYIPLQLVNGLNYVSNRAVTVLTWDLHPLSPAVIR